MSRKVVVYDVEEHFPPKYPKIDGWDELLTETAGFIPLDVKFKQMEQAGFMAHFLESEFSSRDISDMYLNHPEFDITPEDDYEEMYEKIQMRAAWIEEVKKQAYERNSKQSESTTERNSSESSKAQKAGKAESVEDEDLE